MNIPTWQEEFGPEYAVPDLIANHPALADTSWHNDIWPSFEVKGCDRARLWIEHPDPAKREFPNEPGKRFRVTWADNEEDFETDDASEAIAKLLENREPEKLDPKPMWAVEPDRLAAEFCKCLRAELGPVKMIKVIKRNQKETSPGVCHSHDFCDANMVMDQAFYNLTGLHTWETETVEGSGVADSCVDLWNAAWDIAAKAEFDLPKPTQSAQDFFNRDDVKALQEVQKRNRWGTPEHKGAFLKLCELAKSVGAERFLSPEDY